jgi:hypothetical protein
MSATKPARQKSNIQALFNFFLFKLTYNLIYFTIDIPFLQAPLNLKIQEVLTAACCAKIKLNHQRQ